MVFQILADVTVVLHLLFVAFVMLGGLLVAWRRRLVWLHLPAVAWGAWVELAGWTCPLTPLENWLRQQGGQAVYASSFVERYLIPILYPASLSRDVQWALGALVILFNLVVYGWLVRVAPGPGKPRSRG